MIASRTGGPSGGAGGPILNQAGIPSFPFPDSSPAFVHLMWRYSANLQALLRDAYLAAVSQLRAPATRARPGRHTDCDCARRRDERC